VNHLRIVRSGSERVASRLVGLLVRPPSARTRQTTCEGRPEVGGALESVASTRRSAGLDADGHAKYEAHMTKADGTPVTVYVDDSFAVVGVETR